MVKSIVHRAEKIKVLGAWLSRTKDTVYQAATDGFVCAFASTGQIVSILTDDTSPPTVIRITAGAGNDSGVAPSPAATAPVKKDDYWEVETTAAPTIFWIPLVIENL